MRSRWLIFTFLDLVPSAAFLVRGLGGGERREVCTLHHTGGTAAALVWGTILSAVDESTFRAIGSVCGSRMLCVCVAK